jgi:hypothetical protein
MSQRIRDSFDAYLSRIGLADAGPVQRRELRRAFYVGCGEVLCAAGASRVEDGLTNIGADLRRAFYAGCWEVLCAVEAVDGEPMNWDDDVTLIQVLKAECEEFAGRVIEGRDWG